MLVVFSVIAEVAELADAGDLKSPAHREHVGSNPTFGMTD